MRVSLAAVSDNRHAFSGEAAHISVGVVEKFCHDFLRRHRRLATTTVAHCLRRPAPRVASELRLLLLLLLLRLLLLLPAPSPGFRIASSRRRRGSWRARSSLQGGRACQSSRQQRS